MSWQPIMSAPKCAFIGARNLWSPDLRQVWIVTRKEGKRGPEFYCGKQRIFPELWMPLPEPPR